MSETTDILAEANTAIVAASQITVVTNAADMTVVAGRVRLLRDLKKSIEDHFETMKKPARAAWQAVVDQEKTALAPIEAEEKRLRRIADAYTQEQARIAEKAAAAERQRLRDEAEAARAAAEAEREAAEAFGEQTTEAAEAYDAFAHQQLHDAKKVTAAKVMADQGTRAAGTGVGVEWLFEIEDENLLPDWCWSVDRDRIRDEVKRKKGECRIPGVRVYSKAKTIIR